MKINKVDRSHIEKIINKFRYDKNQIKRIETILFNNHIEVFEQYYNMFEDCSKVDFVNEFYEMYKLDIQVRRLLFSAINRFEISLKTKLATYMNQKYGKSSIWLKENFDKNKRSGYLSVINWIIKRMKNTRDFNSSMGKFYTLKGKEIQFSNYNGLSDSTLGNVVHLINSMKEEDKIEFKRNYFNEIKFDNLDKFLGLMNKIRNHIVHLGKIVQVIKIFPSDITDIKCSIDEQNYNYNHIYSFIILFKKLMGSTPTKTLMREIEILFSRPQYANFINEYGYNMEIKKEIESLIR